MDADKIAAGLRAGLEGVSRGEAITFLEFACRNWEMPALTEYDIADVASGLSRFLRSRCSPDNIAALLDAYDEQKRLLAEANAARQSIHELAANIRDRLSNKEGTAMFRDAQRIVELSRPVLSRLQESTNGNR